jgi:hypothetical protein
MAPLQEPTPLPLPSPKKGSFSEAEEEQEKKLHISVVEAATDPPVIVDNYNEEVEHKEESLVAADAGQEGINSSNGDHCEEEEDEEEEEEVWNEEHFGSPAAEATVTTIEQRFGGLVVCEQHWYFKLPSSSQFLFDLTEVVYSKLEGRQLNFFEKKLWLLLLGLVETTGSESAGQAPSPGPWAYSEKGSCYNIADYTSSCSCSSSNPWSSGSTVKGGPGCPRQITTASSA